MNCSFIYGQACNMASVFLSGGKSKWKLFESYYNHLVVKIVFVLELLV